MSGVASRNAISPDCFVPTIVPRRPGGTCSAMTLLVAGLFAPFGSPETAATTLTNDARAELQAVAEQLREHPGLRLRVVGHADARGSRGFNRYLGARRARAVTEALLAAGVARRQIQAVSRGEDDPRVDGEDEAAWAENRRVEIRLDSERSP